MMRFAGFALTLVLASAGAHAQTSEFYNPCSRQGEYMPDPSVQVFYNGWTPGIPWVAWADLLGQQWSAEQIAQRVPFDVAVVHRALAASSVSSGSLLPIGSESYEKYRPPFGGATEEQQRAYNAAAMLYRDAQWADSILVFDNIVKDAASPYRGAAAYSAARATIRNGYLENGMERIGAIVSDPSLREFHIAAYHLIGTMAYNTRDNRLIAAHLAEIVHRLMIPAALVCQDREIRKLAEEANADLNWYIWPAYQNNIDYRGSMMRQPNDRTGNEALAAIHPALDVVRAVAYPTPFASITGWARNEEAKNDEMTQHARERWLATKNPLWGYALARRTGDDGDIDLIKDMIASLSSLPDTPAVRAAIPALRWQFVQNGIRLLLMKGEPEEALAWLRQLVPTRPSRYYSYLTYGSPPFRHNAEAIVNGGALHFIEQHNLDRARWWVANAGAALNFEVADNIRPLLAATFDDVRASWGAFAVDRSMRVVADLLPADKLIALSDTPGMTPDQRRAFLGAGWVRLYLLGRWDEVKALLPKMRDAYPELASDIDEIRGAWTEQTRKRLVARMLLRAPGLTPRTLWARNSVEGARFYSRNNPKTLFSIDPENASDGNWWCSFDVDQLKMDMAGLFFAGPLAIDFRNPAERRYAYWPQGVGYQYMENLVAQNRKRAILQLADQLIAWHPLFKDVDLAELDALADAPSGPRLLSEQAIRWANETNWFWRILGRDKPLPETLHLAVRSTRYGCRRDGDHGEYSRAAFVRLHTMYENTEWAKRTPYWFNRPGLRR